MQNHKLNEFEIEQLMKAFARMRESELAQLLDMVETLVAELKRVSLHNNESPAAAVAARRLISVWNKEVQRILKQQWDHDSVPSS
jgi:hypothetical protein